MDELSWVILQLVQPYFYYSLFFSIAAFLAIHLVIRTVNVRDHHIRSCLNLVQLCIPLIIYALYPPQLDVLLPSGLNSFMRPGMPFLQRPELVSLASVTGYICIAGLALGGLVVAVGMRLNSRVHKNKEITFLMDDEYPRVRSIISARCDDLGIPEPRMGLIEDLRPNAFVGGTRKSSIIVFSIGMLETFTDDELRAAINHELMHLKHHDPLFRLIVAGLTAVSFFNPLAYFSYSAAMREREYMADEGAIRCKRSREALVSALRKSRVTCRQVEAKAALQGLNRLFMMPLFSRHMLSTHPREADRVASLNRARTGRRLDRKKAVFAAACILLLTASLFTLLIDARDQLVVNSVSGQIKADTNSTMEYDCVFMVETHMAQDSQLPFDQNMTQWQQINCTQNLAFTPHP